MLQNEVHINKIWREFFEIWQPWRPLFEQNKTFFEFFIYSGKNMRAFHIIYFLSCFVSVQFKNNHKRVCQPCKNFQKFFLHEILVIILLNYGTLQVLWNDPSKCQFSSFFQAHQKMHLSHTILTIKRHFQGKPMAAYFIKSSKDSNNLVKCYPWCCHLLFLEPPVLLPGFPDLKKLPSDFVDI